MTETSFIQRNQRSMIRKWFVRLFNFFKLMETSLGFNLKKMFLFHFVYDPFINNEFRPFLVVMESVLKYLILINSIFISFIEIIYIMLAMFIHLRHHAYLVHFAHPFTHLSLL